MKDRFSIFGHDRCHDIPDHKNKLVNLLYRCVKVYRGTSISINFAAVSFDSGFLAAMH